MKVFCEYCGSYVDADENENCPNCNAGLGDSIRTQEERLKKEAAEKQRVEEEKAAQKAKAEQEAKENEELFNLGKEIVKTAIGGAGIGSTIRGTIRGVGRSITKFIKGIIIIGIIVLVIYLIHKFGLNANGFNAVSMFK